MSEGAGMTTPAARHGPVPIIDHVAAHGPVDPTPFQARCWEAATRLGGQSAAARELGITQSALRSGLLGYMRRQGIEGQPPGQRLPGLYVTARPDPLRSVDEARDRLNERRRTDGRHGPIAERLTTIGERLDAITVRLARIEAKLDRALARPVATTPDHRRIADGGHRVRGQRRRTA